jgi:casein kinase I family protein HRR25
MIRDQAGDSTAFLIDLGLAQRFRDPATYLHTSYTTDQPVVGTLLFASIRGQQGHTQSRRDDLESLAYTIVYSARGSLPWSGLFRRGHQEGVLQKKISITVEELCEGLPIPFFEFIRHIRSLGFNDKPNYEYLHSVISHCSQMEIDSPDEELSSSSASSSVCSEASDSAPIVGNPV